MQSMHRGKVLPGTVNEMTIHKTAVVHPDAELAPDVEVGAYSIIGKDVRIDEGTKIGSHVVIEQNTDVGPGCRICSHAVIGTDPQDLAYKGQPTFCEIGEGTMIREFVTINRGSKEGSVTKIGKNVLLMTSVHVAHDCIIEDNVIMANLATLAGHCRIGEGAVFGGQGIAHQFVRVGKLAMIGGTSGLMQDVPPFMMAFGHAPAKIVNINQVGIKRAGYSREDRQSIRYCFRLLYRNGLVLSDALDRIESEFEDGPAIELAKFFRESKRGTCRPIGRVTYVESQVTNGERRAGNGEGIYEELTTSLPVT